MVFHNDARSAKANPFHLETEPLFERRIQFQADAPPNSQNTLPRKCFAFLSQQLDDLPVIERVPGRGSDLRVGRDFAFRNGPDGAAERGLAFHTFRRAKQATGNLSRGRRTFSRARHGLLWLRLRSRLHHDRRSFEAESLTQLIPDIALVREVQRAAAVGEQHEDRGTYRGLGDVTYLALFKV